jgi:outer membrane protein OmpA-like peptidoglycan-associated protein
MALSVGDDHPPVHFFTFDGTAISQIADPPSYSTQSCSSSCFYFLSLPTGQILVDGRLGPSTMYVYTPGGTPDRSWLPEITSVPTQLSGGHSYSVSGHQLNGLTQGAAFGDDWNMASNYPLVQLTSQVTGTVSYARTTGMTAMSVAANVASTAQFAVPASITNGPSTLRVIASGFASAPIAVTVTGGVNPPAPAAVTLAFKAKSATLSSAARARLQKLSQQLIAGASVKITGYAKANAALAKKRARAVSRFLSSKVAITIKIKTVTKTRSNAVAVVTTSQ